MDTFLKPYVTVRRNQIISLPGKPKIVGHFSIDYPFEPSQIRLDASNCKYFKRQFTNKDDFVLDLREFDTHREDYDNRIRQQYLFDRMPVFLEYLKKLISKDDFKKHGDKKLLSPDIICEKNFLQNVLRIPGDSQRQMSFLCTKYKGNIYIREHHLKRTPWDYNRILIRHVFFCGKKIRLSQKMRKVRQLSFDQIYCNGVYISNNLDKPQGDINSSLPGTAKFFGVFNLKLHNFTLMYCGTLRGFKTELNDTTDFNDVAKVDVFLKKTYEPLKPTIFSKYVSPTWWSLLFLKGCEKVHIAQFKDCNTINKIETTTVTSLLQEYEVDFCCCVLSIC